MKSILRQKSREVLLKDRDRNSKFFHTSLTPRCKRNRILEVKEGDMWIQDQRGIKDNFSKHFKELFQSSLPKIPEEFKELGQKYVTNQDNLDLLRELTEKEIRSSVEKLHPLKSPGPYGYPGVFYRKYWNVVKSRPIKFVQECFRLKHVPHNFNMTFIVLIPKTK